MKLLEHVRDGVKYNVEELKMLGNLPLFIAREAPGAIIGIAQDLVNILQHRIAMLRDGRGGPLTTDTFMADKGQPYHLK